MVGDDTMRLILQGKASDPFSVDDLWVLFTQSDVLNVASYLVKGYTTADCYLVGGGGGGGTGGDSFYVADANQNNAGGGGGGGGAGQYTKLPNISLLTLPGSVPVTVGEGGDGGLDYRFSAANGQDGKRGGMSQFLTWTVPGGDGGGAGGDATSDYHGGGGGGGTSLDPNDPNYIPKTYWDASKSTVSAKGSRVLNESSSTGGNAGVTNNPNPGYAQAPLPVVGGDGRAIADNTGLGGGVVYTGGGGGGGGSSTSYIADPAIAKYNSRGARGGKAPSSAYGDQGLVGPGILLPNNIWRYAGIGGGGGSGHNLTSITRYPGLDGIATLVSPFDGRPGAGGAGGNGGYYSDHGVFGISGLKGSSGCALFRFYRP
jgi:hypothetical protein